MSVAGVRAVDTDIKPSFDGLFTWNSIDGGPFRVGLSAAAETLLGTTSFGAITARLQAAETNLAVIPSIETAIEAAQSTAGDALETVLAGIKPDVEEVRVLITADTAPAALIAGSTHDGVVLADGDRIGRAYGGEAGDPLNGVWIVQASGAAIRPSNMNSASEISRSRFTVADGSHAGEVWVIQNVAAFVVDTDPVILLRTVSANPMNAEILAARGAFASLGDRLDPISAGIAEIDERTQSFSGATDPGHGIFRVGNKDGASQIETDPALGTRVTGGWLRSTDDALFMISQSDGAILWRLNHDGSVDSTGTSSTPVSAGVWGLLMGAPTHQSIRLSFDLINGATLGRVKLYTDPFLTNEVGDYTIRPFASAGRDQNYSTCRLEIAGLKKNTRYHGRAWANERDDLAMDFSFTTFPAPGEARAVKFLVGACFNVDQYPNAKVLAAMAEKADDGALFLLQLGDFPYSDKTEADPALARDVDIRHLLADPALQALAQVMPIIHKFSDHDAAGNNSHWDKIYVSGDSNQAIIRAGLAAAREREPQYERAQYASGEGDPAKLTNAFSFQCGRQLFIAPDEYTQQRYEDGSGNHIGAAAVVLANGVQPNAAEWNQQQWFLDEIDRAESDATISRVWGCFSLLWLQDVFDGWQEHFQTQQTLICEHIRDNLTKAWGAFGGDPHYQGAIDSFDYAQYNVADLAQPCLITGPMAHETTFGESSVAKWRNVSAKATGANSAYYVVDIDDDGEFDWTSCAVDTVTGVETIQAAPTVSSLDYDPKIAFTAGASSAAASTVTQLQIGKDWFGPASPVTVNWSTDNGQSGSVVFASHHRLRTIAVTAPASGSIIVTISITGSRAATGVQATHTLSAI